MSDDLSTHIAEVGLVDHHVHGALRAELSRPEFEQVITESDRPSAPGTTTFESAVGFATLRWCAPVLGFGGVPTPDEYVERRRELGPEEVNRRLLRAAGVETYLIDTGFNAANLLDLQEMATASGATVREVVRLEAVAETLLAEGTPAGSFPDALRSAIADALGRGVVGTKSIVAYRYGFDLDTSRPRDVDVVAAVEGERRLAHDGEPVRIENPVILSFLLWAGIDAGVPLQIHTGFGDTDLTLHRTTPSLLTDFMKASEPVGTPIVLLHCYPYHQEAAYLAQMFPHVYFDIGEAINYLGVQSRQLVAESFALAPFAKQLYSSDAWGPAELHYLGAQLWRRAMTSVLGEWVDAGDWSLDQARRVVTMIASENAERIYSI